MTNVLHRWIGGDHPEGWRQVGTIDLGDPADIARAQDRGYRIGKSYLGEFSRGKADIYTDAGAIPPAPVRE